MSRDRLDLERKLLGMASPRALALLELTALSSRGCNEFALGHLYGVLELEPGLQALAAVEVRALLQPLAPLCAPHGFGSIAAVHRRGLRNQLIDQLARSPRLLAWRARRVEIAASLQPADYLVRSDGRDLALRAWLLAGLSPDEIAALLGEPEEAIDYVSATRDILPEPPTLAALGRLHGDVAIRILAPYLAARAQHPMDDIGDLLQAGLAAIERGACDEPSLRAFVQLAAMCGRDDLLARVPPGGRYLNDGFSGGEKKRAEILQMAALKPRFAVLDETDSGLDIDALRIVSEGVNALSGSELGVLVITHYQRLLNYIKPQFVHVMMGGRIVESGGPDLALHLEEQGYDWLLKNATPLPTAVARIWGMSQAEAGDEDETPYLGVYLGQVEFTIGAVHGIPFVSNPPKNVFAENWFMASQVRVTVDRGLKPPGLAVMGSDRSLAPASSACVPSVVFDAMGFRRIAVSLRWAAASAASNGLGFFWRSA